MRLKKQAATATDKKFRKGRGNIFRGNPAEPSGRKENMFEKNGPYIFSIKKLWLTSPH